MLLQARANGYLLTNPSDDRASAHDKVLPKSRGFKVEYPSHCRPSYWLTQAFP